MKKHIPEENGLTEEEKAKLEELEEEFDMKIGLVATGEEEFYKWLDDQLTEEHPENRIVLIQSIRRKIIGCIDVPMRKKTYCKRCEMDYQNCFSRKKASEKVVVVEKE